VRCRCSLIAFSLSSFFSIQFRPGRPILVLTNCERVARQCCGILRGATARYVADFTNMDDYINDLVATAKKKGMANTGDAVVVVTGTITEKGATNLMRIQYA